MRQRTGIVLLALAVFASVAGVALADEVQAPADLAPARPTPDIQQRRIASMMQRYEKLGLTEDQKNQIRPLVRAQVDEVRSVRMDTTLAEDVRQSRVRAILDTYRTQISELLTADQKVRLEEIREANRKAVREAGTQKRKSPPVENDDN